MKRICRILFATFIIGSTLMAALPTMPALAYTGTVVASSVGDYPLNYDGFLREMFYANGRHWVFYSDNTNIVTRNSPDGITWSDATTVRVDDAGGSKQFSVYYDGTYFHYTYGWRNTANKAIVYRRGVPNPDGSITWSAVEQTVIAASASYMYENGDITVDTTDKIWVGYCRSPSTGRDVTSRPYITRNDNTDGTWTTAAGYPFLLHDEQNFQYCHPMAMTDGKVYVIWSSCVKPVKGRMWDGSSWGTVELASSLNNDDHQVSAMTYGDDVYVVYIEESSSGDVQFVRRTWGVGWSAEYEVATDIGSVATEQPILSVNWNGDCYVLWGGDIGATDDVMYKKYDLATSTWDADHTHLITETDAMYTEAYSGSAYCPDGKIGFAYKWGTPTKYVKYGFIDAPPTLTVRTDAASAITQTLATMNGTLTADGGETCSVRFQWGTTAALGNDTAWQTGLSTGAVVDANLTGLTAGTTYYYRAQAKWADETTANGGIVSFATSGATTPTATTGDASSIAITTATLGGVLTSLGSYTPVYISFQYGLTAAYGSVTAEQTFTAAGAATANITGLTANTTYHFRIRIRYATVSYAYGADNTFLTLDEFGGSTPTLTVNGANVFLNYATTGDMLFVADITDVYPPYYPNDDVTRYFDVQLLGTDGATVLASVSMPSWGRIPVSIYLNATRAASLTIGALYYIRIYGDFVGTPSDSYHLTAADWRGTDLNALDRWVINTAHILETYYDTTLTAYVMNIGEILNPQGGTIFASGITGLNKIRPDLFQGVASNPIYTTSAWSNGFDAASNWEAQLGTRVVGILNSGGTMCGASGKLIGAMFIDIIMFILIVLFAMRGALGVSLILCIPILFTGAWLGLISIAWVAVIALVLVFLAVIVFYVRQT